MRIVDVGCGTGDFTRYLASLAGGKCTIIGVDARAASLRSAERETAKEGLKGRISYKKGDAYEIPLEDGWADLTCCRTLLMHLTDPLKAVGEMSRVTRKGGSIAAFERGSLNSVFIPGDEKMTRLALRLGEAYVNGVKKLEGKSFNIGERLPTIFKDAGLKDIMAEIQADTYIATDPRRSLRDVRDELEFEFRSFEETRKVSDRAMIAGGASRADVDRYNNWFSGFMNRLLRDEDKLRLDTTFGAGAIYLVAGKNSR